MSIFNLPNLLTGLRLVLIPFVLFFLFSAERGWNYLLIGFLLYLIAIVTDFFDGYIARKYNLTSKFGAFFDSLVDKAIVLTLFFAFTFFTFWEINILFIIIILIREVLLTVMRVWAVAINYSLKTEYHGKIKTVLQMFTQITLWILFMAYYGGVNEIDPMPSYWSNVFEYLPNGLLLIVTIFSVYSGVTYLFQNRKLFVSH